MIGGDDLSWSQAPSLDHVRRVLETIRLRWPDAIVSDDKHDEPVLEPEIPCIWHVARDRAIFELLEKEGVTDAVEPHFISVYVNPDAIHFVFGVEEGCPGALLVSEILAVLEGAQ